MSKAFDLKNGTDYMMFLRGYRDALRNRNLEIVSSRNQVENGTISIYDPECNCHYMIYASGVVRRGWGSNGHIQQAKIAKFDVETVFNFVRCPRRVVDRIEKYRAYCLKTYGGPKPMPFWYKG